LVSTNRGEVHNEPQQSESLSALSWKRNSLFKQIHPQLGIEAFQRSLQFCLETANSTNRSSFLVEDYSFDSTAQACGV